MKKKILKQFLMLCGICAWLWSLTSCKDDFDINKLQDAPRLVVYCFPTESDTTLIAVTKSLPVTHVKGNYEAVVGTAVDAHVSYQVNGQEYEVEKITAEKAPHTLTRTDSAWWMEGQYYVVAKQKAGDKISLEVSADGVESVSASTYIPQAVKVSLDTVYASRSGEYPDRLEATLFDDAKSTDYYALVDAYSMHQFGLAIGGNHENPTIGFDTNYISDAGNYFLNKDKYKFWNFSYLENKKLTTNIDVSGEPLFDKYSKIDEDLGFDDYSYFGGLYIFDDKRINGRPYTFHLKTDGNNIDENGRNHYGSLIYDNWDALFGCEYDLVLYTLTPEYYRFLSAINDAANNDWNDIGIIQISPTYTNVKGGLGIVAGYYINKVKKYIEPIKMEDSL